MINSNPMLRSVVENNPELQAAMSDPSVMQMLSDPAAMSSALGKVFLIRFSSI